MISKNIIGDKNTFAIEYSFYDESRETEFAMYIKGDNILAFENNGETFTTRWNLDELAHWLRTFIDSLREDPYPVDCAGEYAAQKDDIAREFDSDNDDEFAAYYNSLYEWNIRHRWHVASSGAVLADVFFQLVQESVEISWDNRSTDSEVTFLNLCGGVRIPKTLFVTCVDAFLKEYAQHWFN